MGKFYDAEKTNEYFEQMDGAIASYAEQANAVLSSFATFAGDDEQKGEQAEAVKELVGTGEKNLVDRMIDIQQQISEAGAHIRESFETGVDAAPDALIEEDTLLQIEDSFKGYYKTYDDLGTQIEDIATILQSKFGEYATFERPDFESGREAFKDFCGGAAAGGFLQECMEKLEDFDVTETAYLHGLGLDKQLEEFVASVRQSSNVMMSFQKLDPILQQYILMNMGRELSRENGLQELHREGDASDGVTLTFDDDPSNGTYGADQGNMRSNRAGFQFLFWRICEDEAFFEFIKDHDGYEEYSTSQIVQLMEQINSEGCGYVAVVNVVYVEYEGREAEFEEKFGFPMYNDKGVANYDYLLADFYLSTDDKYYLNGPKGTNALVNDIIYDYKEMPDGEKIFEEEYGVPLLGDDGKTNPQARQAVIDAYEDEEVVEYESSGTNIYSRENRTVHYFEEHGITDYYIGGREYEEALSTDEIDTVMGAGQNVIIGATGFNLYDEDGNVMHEDVGAHAMVLTGTTDDGRYIVSSWGEKYYMNPDELDDVRYNFIDIRS